MFLLEAFELRGILSTCGMHPKRVEDLYVKDLFEGLSKKDKEKVLEFIRRLEELF